MFYPDEDYSEIEMYKREFLPMMDDLMKTAKFVPQAVSPTPGSLDEDRPKCVLRPLVLRS